MNVALVHDFLREWGGAEQVLQALHELYPDAPIFTAYVRNGFHIPSDWQIKTSFIESFAQQLPVKIITPILPIAFQSFDFSPYDVVISTTASFAKCIKTKKSTVHICYCHTPPRFLYGLQRERKKSPLFDFLESPIDSYLRKEDQKSAAGVDEFVANSQVVAKRIKQIYDRDAVVIYPPVTSKFSSDQLKDGDYFVTIGRLSPIKHFELAVAACTKLGLKLKVIGTGEEEGPLKSIAGPTVEFLGQLNDSEAAQVIAGSKAVINPIFDEDFGLVPLEVVATGKPVIAFASEAAKETLIDGATGQLFFQPTVQSLSQVLANFDPTKYDAATLKRHAEQFSKQRFEREITQLIESVYARIARS